MEEHTTHHELNFLNNMGKYSTVPTPRPELLRKYKGTLEGRRWDKGVDAHSVSEHVDNLIAKEG